ncbi:MULTISPECIES: Hfq-related RNA-binding protein [Aphanothece]|uniref:Hfq-related RNA-binding protein n=1 Tax=Aphanothece TaxID=1121 RepID=UPI00398504F6
MQSFLDHKPTTLDTAQPSVRHIQNLIRRKQAVGIQVVGGGELEGVIQWQDVYYIGLRQGEEPNSERPLTLINREQVSVIRCLG